MRNVNFGPELLAIILAGFVVGSLATDQTCRRGCGPTASAPVPAVPAPAPVPASVKAAPEWLKDMRNRD